MKTNRPAAILPFLIILGATTFSSAQPASNINIPRKDSAGYFLYVSYCGSRYNRSIRQTELVIDAVKLPVRLLKKMPRLKENGKPSSRNFRICMKQQEVIRKYGGEKLVVRVNKKKFSSFYPKGLRKGIIIGPGEYNQWDFQEKFIPAPDPVRKKGRYYFYRFWYKTDPVNISYENIHMT